MCHGRRFRNYTNPGFPSPLPGGARPRPKERRHLSVGLPVCPDSPKTGVYFWASCPGEARTTKLDWLGRQTGALEIVFSECSGGPSWAGFGRCLHGGRGDFRVLRGSDAVFEGRCMRLLVLQRSVFEVYFESVFKPFAEADLCRRLGSRFRAVSRHREGPHVDVERSRMWTSRGPA